MKQFKYPVSFKCESPEQMERLAKELEKLGCDVSEVSLQHFDTCPLIVNNRGGVMGVVNNIYSEHQTRYNRHLCQSEEEFIAKAAMVNDDKFYVGEILFHPKEGLFKIERICHHGRIDFQRLSDGYKNWFVEGSKFKVETRKATDTEIISHFRKSEPKQFREWVEPNNKEPFTVEGKPTLLLALCKDICDAGLPVTSGIKNRVNAADYAAFEGWLIGLRDEVVAFRKPQNIHPRHYKLPEQYNEVLQAFIDFYKEEKPREVEVTLSNGAKVIVTDDVVKYKKDAFTIKEVKKLHNILISKAHLPVYNGFSDYNVVLKAHIASNCCEGMEVTAQDTQLILDAAKNFEA